MKIHEIVRDAADTIREIGILSRVAVIEEDKGNVATELESAVGRTNFAVVVGWDGFTPRIVGETAPHETPFGSVTIVATIFEKPVVNRANPSAPRILQAAQEIAKALDGAASEDMDDVMHLRRISPVSEVERSGVVMCTVEFETKATL